MLAFDQAAAVAYVLIGAGRRKSGRPTTEFDGQIAAIAHLRNAVLATRDTRDFTGCGIELIPGNIGDGAAARANGWSVTVPNGLRRCQAGRNGPEGAKAVQNGPERTETGQNNAEIQH